MFSLVKLDGFFRRVIERKAMAGGSNVDVIVGFRERRSNSSKSPGPGWRLAPGASRVWLKREPRSETRFVKDDEVIETADWPVGIEKHGFTVDQYEAILKPSIDAGVEASGAIGKRKAPILKIETVEAAIKEAGLAMPSADEFISMVESIWDRHHRVKPRAATSGSAIVTGRKPKTAADKKAEAEAVQLADEAEAARLAKEAETEAEVARLAKEAEAAQLASGSDS